MQGTVVSPVHFDEYVAPVNVGLSIVRPHADGLSVERIGLLKSSAISSYQVSKIQKYVQMIWSDASLVTLSWLGFW